VFVFVAYWGHLQKDKTAGLDSSEFPASPCLWGLRAGQ